MKYRGDDFMHHERLSRVCSELGNRRDIKMYFLLQMIYTVKAFEHKKCVWPFQKKKFKGLNFFLKRV